MINLPRPLVGKTALGVHGMVYNFVGKTALGVHGMVYNFGAKRAAKSVNGPWCTTTKSG